MSESAKERARERLATAELATVLEVSVANLAEDQRTPGHARWLVAALLILGFSVVGGAVWMQHEAAQSATQNREPIDVVRPRHQRLFPEQLFHSVRSVANIAAIPADVDTFAIPAPGDVAVLRALLDAKRVRRLGVQTQGEAGDVYRVLGGAADLEMLWLSKELPRPSHLRELRLAPRLHSLGLTSLPIGKADVFDRAVGQAIAELPKLQSLVLLGLDLRPDGVRQLQGLPDLDALMLELVRVDNEVMAALAQIRLLRVLTLSPRPRQELTKEMLESMATMTNLRVLDVGLAVDDEALANLPGWLEALGLSDCADVTAGGIQSLARLKQLRSLSFRQHTEADLQVAMAELIKASPLENYSCAVEVPSEVVWSALRDSATLRGLRMCEQGREGNESCLREAAKVSSLEYLELRCRALPTVASFKQLRALKHLQEVVVRSMEPVSPERAKKLQSCLGDGVVVTVSGTPG